MRYKKQQSSISQCTESTRTTIEYFRKRPISVIVLVAVFIWIIIAFKYSTKPAPKKHRIRPKSKGFPMPMIGGKGRIDPFDLANMAKFNRPMQKADEMVEMQESIRNELQKKREQKLQERQSIANDEILQQNNDNNDNNEAISIEQKVQNAKKVLVTYGQNCCTAAKKRMCESAFSNGNMITSRDECHAYDKTVMDSAFTEKNKNILQQGRGAGYWLWKPYIIYKWLTDDSMEDDNSYLIYSDAGASVIGDVGYVLRFMEENDSIYKGVLFFGVGFDQRTFCKRDAFVLQECDRDECYDAMQINAFAAFFRKSEFSRMVVKKWLDDCQDERILTDSPNTQGKPNLSGFRDHRHDQAAITNIMIANGWNYDTTNGPILDKVFHHDRFKA